MITETAAFGQALAALDESPETAVGKSVVGFGGVEMLGELALGDVGNERDMGGGRLHWPAAIEGAEMAGIPGAAEQGREVAPGPPHGMERGGEFLREHEEAPIGGRLLIAQSIDKATRGQASGGDAGIDPRPIDCREEAADLVPTGPLAGLTGFADQRRRRG